MLNAVTVKDAVRQLLAQRYPGCDIHVNRCPGNFERPAFLVQSPTTERQDVSRDIIEETCYLTITCFTPVDGRGESDADAIDRVQQEVLDLFRPGHLRIGDRTVTFTACTGGADFDRAWVDVQTTYLEVRDPDPAQWPLMEEIVYATTTQEGLN